MKLFRTLILLIIIFLGTQIQATRPTETRCWSVLDDAVKANIPILFQNVNRFRVERDIAPMAFNNELCILANEHATHIATRDASNFSLSQRSPDGTSIRDWLSEVWINSEDIQYTYPPENDYGVRLAVFATQAHDVANVLEFLRENQRDLLDFAGREYREVGIGYRFNIDTNTHYYVFIGASRPNILPVTVVNPGTPAVLAANVQSQFVEVWINNENYAPEGSSNAIGSVRFVRISEGDSDPLPCPANLNDNDDWRLYNYRIPQLLDPGIGPHVVHVDMCDSIGRQTRSSYNVLVANDNLPVARFEPGPSRGTAPLSVLFTNNSINASRYEWDFNNDDVPDAFDEEPLHTFTVPGIYYVSLTAFNAGGAESDPQIVEVIVDEPLVAPAPLLASFTASPDPDDPLRYAFDASASTGSISNYTWQFDDDGLADASGQTVDYTFPQSGIYDVMLTVISTDGTISETSQSIEIDAPVCTPEATIEASPVEGVAPLTVNFTARQSLDSGCEIAAYAWDANNDGIIDNHNPEFSVTFDEARSQIVSLTVTGTGNTSSTQQITINVRSPGEQNPSPPQPTQMLPQPTQQLNPPEVQLEPAEVEGAVAPFEQEICNITAGDYPVEWDTNGDNLPDGFDDCVTVSFANPGSYAVVFRLQWQGGEIVHVWTVNVAEPAIEQTVIADPIAEFTVDMTSGDAPLSVQFSNQSQNGIRYLWDFDGDGLTDSVDENSVHEYSTPGEYEAQLTVIGEVGTDTRSVTITVTGIEVESLDTPTPMPTGVATQTPTEMIPTATGDNPVATPGNPPPGEIIEANINISLHPSENTFVFVNEHDEPLLATDLNNLAIVQGEEIIFSGIGWYEFALSNFSDLDSSSCFVLYGNTSDEGWNFEEDVLPTGCLSLLYNQGINRIFWSDSFTVTYDGQAVASCPPDVACLINLTQGANVIGDAPETDDTNRQTPLDLYWDEDYFVVKNAGESTIPAGVWIDLQFSTETSSFPDPQRTWTEQFSFSRVRPAECVILINTALANSDTQFDYNEMMVNAACVNEVTFLTVTPFWNQQFDVYFDDNLIETCPPNSLCEIDISQ